VIVLLGLAVLGVVLLVGIGWRDWRK